MSQVTVMGGNPLAIDFFASDFGPARLRRLTNRMQRARKDHECHGNGQQCLRGVLRGDRYRKLVEVSDEMGLQVYRWCPQCLDAALLESLP